MWKTICPWKPWTEYTLHYHTLIRITTNYPNLIRLVSRIPNDPCIILIHIWALICGRRYVHGSLGRLYSIIISLIRIPTNYPNLIRLVSRIPSDSCIILIHIWALICGRRYVHGSLGRLYSIIISLIRITTNYHNFIRLVSCIPSDPCNILVHIWTLICGRRYVHGSLGLNILHYHIFNKNYHQLS